MAENNTPQEDIQQYDEGMSSQGTRAFLDSIFNEQTQADDALSAYAGQQYAQQQNQLQQEQLGYKPTGVGVDPNASLAPIVSAQDAFTVGGGVIGGALGGPLGLAAGIAGGAALADATGSESMLSRSLAAGTGQLIQGTGDTFEYLKAVVTPWDDDVDQQTTIGDFLQRKGSDIMNANTTFIPEEMKSVGWNQ